ncbi:hypothetical protein NY08_4264 [Rhodococcus sp. B7740]|nr:hypothetical protein NY08_4264 [Rhodococcus sp. B7740]
MRSFWDVGDAATRTTESVCTQFVPCTELRCSSGVDADQMIKHNNYLRGVYFESVETE